MLIISFDAVGDREYEQLKKYPNFAAFAGQASVSRGVSTLFLSNTYPVHTSVVTGVVPGVHGIISNTEAFPSRHPLWNTKESMIKAKTIWQAAAERGIDTAAVLWPVTAYSKTIRYNIPEVMARPGKSQVLTSLRAGSKRLQLKMYLRHRLLLKGLSQPELDSFSTACMVDILREFKPGLALVHLTAYDTLCHIHGKDSVQLNRAYESLDKNLGILLEAAGENREVILFSDHSQIDVHTIIDPNTILAEEGLLIKTADGYQSGEKGCYIEACGGSAFLHGGKLTAQHVEDLKKIIAQKEGFRRFLTAEEMRESGHKDRSFGFCAQAGYCYENAASKEKATHGYPLDMPDYSVFYMVRGMDFKPGVVTDKGSLLDIAPIVARGLGLDMLGENKGRE